VGPDLVYTPPAPGGTISAQQAFIEAIANNPAPPMFAGQLRMEVIAQAPATTGTINGAITVVT
jgi:hypothetical protein